MNRRADGPPGAKVLWILRRNAFFTFGPRICMITDISGTAYTYAFLTKKPVVFYCSYKMSLERNYKHLFYFKKRF